MRASTSLLLAIPVAALLAAFPAAGEGNPYNGSWHATFKSVRGIPLDGTVVVDNDVGSWAMNIQGRNDPCIGRPFPIVVQKASAEELALLVNGSKALAGCQDTPVTFRPVDPATLKGSFNGIEFTLTKK